MSVQYIVFIWYVWAVNEAWENACFTTPCWCFWYLGKMLKIEHICACMDTSGSNFISQKQRMVFTFSTWLQVISTLLRFPLFALRCIDFSLAILSAGETWLPLLSSEQSSWLDDLCHFSVGLLSVESEQRKVERQLSNMVCYVLLTARELTEYCK